MTLKSLAMMLGMLTYAGTGSSANINSPDFDPVALMRALDPDWEPPVVSEAEMAKHALGSAERPVRTQGPGGQKAYLDRLLCENGKTPTYARIRMVGPSPYGFPMDAFELDCGLRKTYTIHMDFYHPRHVEQQPVPGFTLRGVAE